MCMHVLFFRMKRVYNTVLVSEILEDDLQLLLLGSFFEYSPLNPHRYWPC